jgi:hypothetical protein
MSSGLVAAVGWAGALVLVVGYAQTSRGRWPGDGPVFQACSISGSASLALAAAAGGVWSSAVLNVAWMAIGVAVVTSRSRRRPGHARPRSDQAEATA